MKLTNRNALSTGLAAFLALGSSSFAANILTNGDFATNDTTGWTEQVVSGAGFVSAATGSAAFVSGGANDGNLFQNFTPQTGQTLVSWTFLAADPSGGDRSMNAFLVGTGGQINFRVRPAGAVQIFQSGGASWQTIPGLTSVNDNSTVNTISFSINDYGANWDYDVTLNGNTASGLSFFQNGAPTDFSRVTFTNDFGATVFSVDDVVVMPIPEPAGAALLGIAAMTLLVRRKQ